MNSILTNDAIKFLTTLEREFGPKRKQLLEQRKIRQKEINQGIFPDFPNSHIRNTEWTVAKIPDDLQDRKVEITGPTERKTIITDTYIVDINPQLMELGFESIEINQ